MHPPPSSVFYRPESRESDQYPYLTKTSEDSTEKKSKMFGSVRKSLHRSRQYIEESESEDTTPRRKHKQRKKRRGFGISLFGKKNRRSVPVETDSSSSTSSSETESPPPKPPSTPLPPPMPVTPVRLNEKDLRSLRDACERQSREIESLRQVVVFLRRELKQSPLRHRRNVAALARLRKESFQSVENMKSELLVQKKAENEALTASLLNHFRTTVETRVKEVQKRINACNNQKKMVLENAVTPFHDFYSQILAYAIAGFTVVGSVLVYLFILLQSLLGFNHPPVNINVE
ncbi:hypothetical protein WA588_001894 [Blastocystis sp. NMH]